MEEQKQEPTTLERLKKVVVTWNVSRRAMRTEHAMLEVAGIVAEAETREQRLKTIAEDARRDRELAERMLS